VGVVSRPSCGPCHSKMCKANVIRLVVKYCLGAGRCRRPVTDDQGAQRWCLLWGVCVCVWWWWNLRLDYPSLQHFKKQKLLIPERTIWRYFTQIASALEHMHLRRVMHRGGWVGGRTLRWSVVQGGVAAALASLLQTSNQPMSSSRLTVW